MHKHLMRGNGMRCRVGLSSSDNLALPREIKVVIRFVQWLSLLTEWVSDNSCYHTLFLYTETRDPVRWDEFGALLC